jgi:hypothetical protein
MGSIQQAPDADFGLSTEGAEAQEADCRAEARARVHVAPRQFLEMGEA